MHAGLERNRIRKHLLVFALAAPVMSMVTYLGLSKVSLIIPSLSRQVSNSFVIYQNLWSFMLIFAIKLLPQTKMKLQVKASTG